MDEGHTFERRRARRVPVQLEVAYEDADRQVFLPVRDVSESGLFLFAPDPPSVGMRARVVMELPGHPAILRLGAVVTRRERLALSGFALQFDPASFVDPTRRAMREFVERSLRAPTDPTE